MLRARLAVRIIAASVLTGVGACTTERAPTGAPQTAAQILSQPSGDVQFGTAAHDAAHSVAAGKLGVVIVGTTSGAFEGSSNAGGYDAFVRLHDKRGVAVWTQQFGTGADDGAASVAMDRGGVYVTGTTSGALGGVGNLGASDGYVRSLDASGSIRWQTRLASAGADSAFGVAVDRDAVYVSGVLRGPMEGTTVDNADGYIIRLDAQTGVIVWMTRFVGVSGGDDAARAVTVDGDGVYVAATYTGGTSGAGPGGEDAYLVKIDAATGAFVWLSSIASAQPDIGWGVSHAGGTTYLVGVSAGHAFAAAFTSLTGALQWRTTLATTGTDVATTTGADRSAVQVAGWTTGAFDGFSNAGGTDAFHASLDATSGAIRSMSQFGTGGTDTALGSFLDGAVWHLVGNTGGALAGVSQGGFDAFWLQRAVR